MEKSGTSPRARSEWVYRPSIYQSRGATYGSCHHAPPNILLQVPGTIVAVNPLQTDAHLIGTWVSFESPTGFLCDSVCACCHSISRTALAKNAKKKYSARGRSAGSVAARSSACTGKAQGPGRVQRASRAKFEKRSNSKFLPQLWRLRSHIALKNPELSVGGGGKSSGQFRFRCRPLITISQPAPTHRL